MPRHPSSRRTVPNPLPLLILMVLAIVGLPAHGEASSSDSTGHYAVAGVTVTDGLPVREVEDGVLFEQRFTSDCRLETDSAEPMDKPAATTIGSTIHLDVTLTHCGSVASSPVTQCRWHIAGTSLAGTASFQGLEGTIAVTAPERTGIYELHIGCSVDGGEGETSQNLSRVLFTTFRHPLSTVSPPRIDWYRQACDWGSGFARGARETDILTAMNTRLYHYGREHWRYGSFPPEDSSACPSDLLEPCCSGEGESLWCSCRWQALVIPDTPCDFGSCYQFADVLEAMAATLGIGGVTDKEIKGAAGRGFLTVAGAVSLDPRYKGNVLCQSKTEACLPYLFSSHSLRRKGDLYFDPTFDRVYTDPNEPIGRSLGVWSQDLAAYLVVDTPALSCKRGTGYGDWHLFSFPDTLLAANESPCGRIPEAEKGTLASLTGEATFPSVDDGTRDYAEQLSAEVEVAIQKEGTYSLVGVLAKGEQTIAHVIARRSHRHSSATLTAGEGRYTVRLLFSGEEIFHSGEDGPYQLHVTLYSQDSVLDQLSLATPAYDHLKFGEVGADLLEASATGLHRDGKFEGLRITPQILVRKSGHYLLAANVSVDGDTVLDTSEELDLTRGPDPQTVMVDLVDHLIATARTRKTVVVTLELYDDLLQEIDSHRISLKGLGPTASE